MPGFGPGGPPAAPDASATGSSATFAGGVAGAFRGLAVSVQAAAVAHDALAAAATAAVQPLNNVQTAMKETSAFARALRDAMEGTGWRVNEGQERSQAQTDYANQTITRLQNLENQLEQVFGNNNQAAAIIQRSIDSIRGGGDPGNALAALRGILGAYLPGLEQELTSTDPAIRDLALRLEQLLAGTLY